MTPGQLSADGRWQWDGTRWVPAPPAPAPTAAAYLPAPPAAIVSTPPTNSLAVVSLVAAILSWFACPFVGAVVAIITGHVARSQIRRTGEVGSGTALAGLVIGYVHLAVLSSILLVWLVILGGFAALLANGSH